MCKKPTKIREIIHTVTRALYSSSSLLELNYDHTNALGVFAALLCVFLVERGPDFAKEIIQKPKVFVVCWFDVIKFSPTVRCVFFNEKRFEDEDNS